MLQTFSLPEGGDPNFEHDSCLAEVMLPAQIGLWRCCITFRQALAGRLASVYMQL